MKRLLSVFLTLVLLLSLTACGGKNPDPSPENNENDPVQEEPTPENTPENEPEPVFAVVPLQIMKGAAWFEEYDDNYNQLCLAEWEDIALIDDYPELSAALFELNNDQSAGAYSFVQEWLPDARDFLEASPDFFGGFTNQSTYTVQRADSLILSLREDFSSYTGGVHGNYGVVSWNFDTASGTQLELADVLTDTDGLDEILTEKIRLKYDFEPFDSLDEMLMDYTPEDYTWTLDYQGITFYFSPYEIASYAAGLLTATIWFDEMPELFHEEYTVAPEGGYAVGMPNWYDLDVDLNPGDNGKDTLCAWTQDGEYGTKTLALMLNGQEYTEESWSAFSITPYLVCTEEQNFYLCVEASGENDYCTMYIYDLNGATPQLIADYSGAGFIGVWDPEAAIDGVYYTVILNDPTAFTLGSRCNLLGTKTAYRDYTVGSDGSLLPLTDDYVLEEDLDSITSSIPLDVTLLPQNTVETLPAGTEFFFLRTDNETWVDLVMTDGQECRIVIEEVDWTPCINGIPEWECFDNLMYAG